MHIGILNYSHMRTYSSGRFREAGMARGHTLHLLAAAELGLEVRARSLKIYQQGRELQPLDVVIPRIGAASSAYGVAVLEQLELQGVAVLNSSRALRCARDKLRTMQLLAAEGVPVPPSAFVARQEDIAPAIERIGGAPVVIKILEGTQGIGVMYAESLKSAEAILETLQVVRQPGLVQHFVSESRGRDVRAFVVGGQVVAAMRRIAHHNEFRSNVHRGGQTEPLELSADYRSIAIKAAAILQLEMAGVDILEGRDGPVVMEVNASPGLEGIEGATRIDIATMVIKRAEEIALKAGRAR